MAAPSIVPWSVGTVNASTAAMSAMLGRIKKDGGVTVEDAEAVEEQVDAAGRLLSGVSADHSAMKDYVRRALVEAEAPDWHCEGGVIFKEPAD
jgi:hypothetical protein